MSMNIKFKLTGDKKVLQNLRKAESEIKNNILSEYELSAYDVQEEAKRILLAGGHYITGNLYRSIKGRLESKYKHGKLNNILVSVGSEVHYAIYMERYDPYLFPAMERYKPVLQRRLQSVMR
jgi:hypothetical protein